MKIDKSILNQEVRNCVKKYAPDILLSVGVIGTVMSGMMRSAERSHVYYRMMYRLTNSRYYDIRYMQLTHSNNWLRMHGYPMNKRG